MDVLNFREDEKGWWLAILFDEKGSNRKRISQAVWFPKIDNERQMVPFFNNHLNTVHNYGTMVVRGFVRTMPQEVRDRHVDSLMWERQRNAGKVVGTTGASDKYRPTRDENPSFIRMGLSTELEKAYPKTYVKTVSGWVPQLLMNYYQSIERMERENKQKMEKIDADFFAEKQFNQEFRDGLENGNFMGVLKKWTRPIEPEAPAIVEEKKYVPIEIPAMNTSEKDGYNFKPGAGLFEYSLIRKTISGGRKPELTIKDYVWK